MVKCRSRMPRAMLTPRRAHAETIFKTVLNNTYGLWIDLNTINTKIHLYIEEIEEWRAKTSDVWGTNWLYAV